VSIHLPQGSPSPVPDDHSEEQAASLRTNGEDRASCQEWSGLECLRALYRRKATIAWIAGLGILAAWLVSLMQPRLYESQASLEIQGANENFLNLRDVYPTAGPGGDTDISVQTQAEILQDDAVIVQVVQKLGLAGEPEFRGTRSIWRRFRGASEQDSSTLAERNAVDAVRENLKIVPVRGTRIIRVAFDARDPQLAAEVANAIARTFIDQNIEARQRAARQTRDALKRQIEEIRGKLGSGRTREADGNRQFYEAMVQKANEASVAASLRESNIRLVSPAQPATFPSKPNLPLNLAIGTLGGLALAIGWVMVQEQTKSVLRVPGEAGTYLTLPELGAIPRAVNGNLNPWRFLSSANGQPHVERAALEQRFSHLSESFHATLASILSANRNGDHPRILVVTSSRSMEGKTTVVSNLGIALAEISDKVLLVDGDMRRPRLHKVFDQANSWGLSDVLREKNAIEDLPLDVLVKKTSIPHLYLLPSGSCTDNIFGLLNSGRMARLLPRFRKEFDYVLVDAPPCLEFADARIMARYAEQLLLVVRANHTDRKAALAAVQRLLLDGIPVMGVILNRWNPEHGDIYGYTPQNGFERQGLA
jgi:receptor protein-tyrosine kinase